MNGLIDLFPLVARGERATTWLDPHPTEHAQKNQLENVEGALSDWLALPQVMNLFPGCWWIMLARLVKTELGASLAMLLM